MVKGNVAVIRKSGDGEFEDMEMNMHFVNKKIKYVWDANLQVSINLLVNKGLFACYYSVAYLLGVSARGRIKEVWGKCVL